MRILSRAFGLADQADSDPIRALAAYRLGAAAIALESGARGTRSAEASVSPLAETNAAHCGDLSAGGVPNPSIALQCAAAQAEEAGEHELAALAQLRLARLRLAGAANPASPTSERRLREMAAAAAISGLRQGERDVAPAIRSRLLEAALDAKADDPLLERAAAVLVSEAAGDRAREAEAVALTARIALVRQDHARAIPGLQRAILLESGAPAPLRLPDWYMLMAEADSPRREQHVAAAYRALEAIRQLLPPRDRITEEPLFATRMRRVFEAALEYDLPAQGEGDIASAQLVLEAYRQAEIESVFGSDCVPPRRPVTLNQLRPNEIVLYPVLLGDRVELIYASGRSGGYQRLRPRETAGRTEITRLVRTLTTSLASNDERQDWQAAARRLYALIIQPIESQLGGDDDTLIIVPDGPLRTVPFAALQDANGNYLLQRTRIAIAPALAYAQPGRDLAGRRSSIVAASLEQTVDVAAMTFPELHGARAEAMAAADGARVLHDFTPNQLENALNGGGVDVLHLATHASFEGSTERTYIVARGDDGRGVAIPLARLRSMIEFSRTRGDELDLLVLSACETALGDDQASMGLAGAAVQSGARSALASLWQVNDARYRGVDAILLSPLSGGEGEERGFASGTAGVDRERGIRSPASLGGLHPYRRMAMTREQGKSGHCVEPTARQGLG